jgi:hypothetical protein
VTLSKNRKSGTGIDSGGLEKSGGFFMFYAGIKYH